RLTRQETTAEFGGLVAQRVVGERLVLGLENVDLVNEGPEFLDFALGRIAAELGQPVEHRSQKSDVSGGNANLSNGIVSHWNSVGQQLMPLRSLGLTSDF